MISKTDSSIDILKKSDLCISHRKQSGSVPSAFPVVFFLTSWSSAIFNMVKTLDMLESGPGICGLDTCPYPKSPDICVRIRRVRVFVDLIRVRIMVALFLRRNNHTRVQWRQNSCAKGVISRARLSLPQSAWPSVVKMESELYVHVSTLHTHILVWVRWIAEASEAATLGSWVTHPLSVLPSVPLSHTWNKMPDTIQTMH